jgi:hypothetical protein
VGVGTTGISHDQRFRNEVDAGLTLQTNNKTNNAGLTFIGIPVYFLPKKILRSSKEKNQAVEEDHTFFRQPLAESVCFFTA